METTDLIFMDGEQCHHSEATEQWLLKEEIRGITTFAAGPQPLTFSGPAPHKSQIESAWALIPVKYKSLPVTVFEFNERQWKEAKYGDFYWGMTGAKQSGPTYLGFTVWLRSAKWAYEHAIHEFGHVILVQTSKEPRMNNWYNQWAKLKPQMPTSYGRSDWGEGMCESGVKYLYPRARGYRKLSPYVTTQLKATWEV